MQGSEKKFIKDYVWQDIKFMGDFFLTKICMWDQSRKNDVGSCENRKWGKILAWDSCMQRNVI